MMILNRPLPILSACTRTFLKLFEVLRRCMIRPNCFLSGSESDDQVQTVRIFLSVAKVFTDVIMRRHSRFAVSFPLRVAKLFFESQLRRLPSRVSFRVLLFRVIASSLHQMDFLSKPISLS